MEAHFTSLTKRQTMLLLTAVAFGGSEVEAALDFLPEDEAALLKHRAHELLQMPRDKRVPLLVQEMKRLVTARRGQMFTTDAEKLASVLKKERRALMEIVLKAVPAGLADEVRNFLPPGEVALTREVKPEILAIIRWKLEEALAREGAGRTLFKFSDVLLLTSRDLSAVSDRIGIRVLGQAIAGIPEQERSGAVERLPPDQRRLAEKAATALASRALAEADARELLSMHGWDEDPSLAIRSAGARHLARACLAQSPDFATRVLDRHRNDFGKLLARWVKEERSKVVGKVDAGRTDIVAELERLQLKGVIEPPVRLMPPRRKGTHSGMIPGGKVVAPPPPVPREPPQSERAALAPPRRRDLVAERAARQAGAAPSRPEGGGDPRPAPSRPERGGERPPARKDGTQLQRPRRGGGSGRGPGSGSR